MRRTCVKDCKSRWRPWDSFGVVPVFGIVRVGERPNDVSYERGAMKRAASLGVEVRRFLLPETATEDELVAVLEKINHDDSVHGCLLFRPLPPHLDTQRVGRTLRPEKDIDAMTTASMGGLLTQTDVGFAPAPPPPAWSCCGTIIFPFRGKRSP